MTINAMSGRLGVTELRTIDTTQQYPLGMVVRGYDSVAAAEGEYMYVQFGGAVSEGMFVQIDLANKVTTVTSTSQANSGKALGVFISATAAVDTNYGWVQVSGKAKASVNGAVVADAKVFLTAVAGKVDDAVIAGSQVLGAEFATADGTPAANFAYVNIDRPACQSQIT